MNEEKPRDCGETPWEFITAVEHSFDVKIVLDVCASPHNAKAKKFYTREDDGLKKSWIVRQGYAKTRVAWCNPPYSNVAPWIEKAFRYEYWMMLLKCDPSTKWFKMLIHNPDVNIVLLSPRIQHIPPPGVEYSSNEFPSILVLGSHTSTSDSRISFWDWKRDAFYF